MGEGGDGVEGCGSGLARSDVSYQITRKSALYFSQWARSWSLKLRNRWRAIRKVIAIEVFRAGKNSVSIAETAGEMQIGCS